MIYRGIVKNGAVVLIDDATLPEGVAVNVELVQPPEVADDFDVPTLYERFKNIIGVVDDLPADMAKNHDHYLYGTPKNP